jgi:DNA polymerase
MNNQQDEFLELLADAREYAAYLDEMGVAFLEPGEIPNSKFQVPGSKLEEVQPPAPSPQPPTPEPASLFGDIAPDNSLQPSDETLEDIKRDIGPDCRRCPLCGQGRRQVVNSVGNPGARLMFVGEAPGADEDAQGEPFVGKAGQLLNKIIEAIGLKREEVFIGNINRCRPPANRTPLPDEAAVCKPFLMREIAVVRPDIIVVLGNTAMKHLLDTKEGITKMRGVFRDYHGVTVMPTFHPAYLLRDPSKKRETWEDMKKVRDYLTQNPPKE